MGSLVQQSGGGVAIVTIVSVTEFLYVAIVIVTVFLYPLGDSIMFIHRASVIMGKYCYSFGGIISLETAIGYRI